MSTQEPSLTTKKYLTTIKKCSSPNKQYRVTIQQAHLMILQSEMVIQQSNPPPKKVQTMAQLNHSLTIDFHLNFRQMSFQNTIYTENQNKIYY